MAFPKDPIVGAQARDEEEEGAESSKSRELSQQMNFHVVVINEDQPRT